MSNDLPTSFELSAEKQTAGTAETNPSCPVIARTVQIGGESKTELLARLVQNGVELNEAARVLFTSDKFITSDVRSHLRTVELRVRNLGFPQGATTSEVYTVGRSRERSTLRWLRSTMVKS